MIWRETRRRIVNFFVGPHLMVTFDQEPWRFRLGIVPEWLSSEGFHFTRVGVNVYFASRILGVWWVDNN
jgi:hypothetical protein